MILLAVALRVRLARADPVDRHASCRRSRRAWTPSCCSRASRTVNPLLEVRRRAHGDQRRHDREEKHQRGRAIRNANSHRCSASAGHVLSAIDRLESAAVSATKLITSAVTMPMPLVSAPPALRAGSAEHAQQRQSDVDRGDLPVGAGLANPAIARQACEGAGGERARSRVP